jgi:ketose-bisphosphate aldolase
MKVVEVIRRAHTEGWALGQFNLSSLEVLQGIVAAANEMRSPVIVGVSMGSLRHAGLPYLAGLIAGARAAAKTPLFFHLDHGDSFATIKECIAIGFDSVMIDASRNRYEQNVRLVSEVVEYAHSRGVGVEAQIGETWDEETGDLVETRTDPMQAAAFVWATGIDYLAISFGNTPGRIDGKASIDLSLVRTCAAASPVPLVLHGGTSIPDSAMRDAIAAGAAKVNIDTAIRKAATGVLQAAYMASAPPSDPRKSFAAVREAVREVVAAKMALFGSAQRAGAVDQLLDLSTGPAAGL